MNQILITPKAKAKYKWLFQFELILSLIVVLSCLFYVSYLFYQESKRNFIAQSLLQPYSISRLYSYTNPNSTNSNNSSPFVIATLEIPSLELALPVLSEMNDELLKLSVCRFYGPMPNQIGNLCIAGHNYNDDSFFSNLPKLSVGDIIFLTDSSYHKFTYTVYEKFEISDKNTSCTNQETNGQKEITLVTCNNFTGNRVIIKAIAE